MSDVPYHYIVRHQDGTLECPVNCGEPNWAHATPAFEYGGMDCQRAYGDGCCPHCQREPDRSPHTFDRRRRTTSLD